MLYRILENILSLLATKKILEWERCRKSTTKLSKKDTTKIANKLEHINNKWESYSEK